MIKQAREVIGDASSLVSHGSIVGDSRTVHTHANRLATQIVTALINVNDPTCAALPAPKQPQLMLSPRIMA